MNFRHKADVGFFVLRESVRSFIRHRGAEKAAVLAYNSFFALFAVFLLVLFVVGQIMASSQAAMGAVERVAAQLFPLGSESIMREVRGLAEQRVWGLLSLPILFWTVTPLAAAIRGAFDLAHGRERALPFFKEKLLDALAVFLMLILLVALVVSEIVYAIVMAKLAGRLPILVRMTDVVVPLLVTVGLLAFLHYVFTPGRTRIGSVVAGALASAALLTIIGPIMTAVMKFDPNFGVAFGSLKAVFILLLWVHYSFVAILAGVEISANVMQRESLLVRELFAAPEKLDRNIRRLGRAALSYAEGAVIFREGDEGDSLYFVAKGEVALMRGGQVLRTMKSGEYFGEMAMLLKASRTATAMVCEDDTRLVSLSATNIETVLAQNPAIVMKLLREMAERVRATDGMLKG
jgi:YihY family inner membrane protein